MLHFTVLLQEKRALDLMVVFVVPVACCLNVVPAFSSILFWIIVIFLTEGVTVLLIVLALNI